MTDRFARTDGSTSVPCNTTNGFYCGGTWRGTIDKLDYIQGMGFDAVMISPIVENIEGRVYYGEAYHGYWPLDLYSLNSHFGTRQDLLDLSAALHSRGMFLMMDTVINNMASMTNGSNPAKAIDYSVFKPFNNADYFHPYCKITDWNNFTNAQLCQTGDNYVALADLYTEHEDVQTLFAKWARDVMKTYSIDGLRIDAAKHVNPGFLHSFEEKVDTFMTGEVLQGQVDIICDYQSKYLGSMPNYPIYYSMLRALTKGNISELALTIAEMKASCPDVTSLVSFSENHDVGRIASMNDDIALAKNILAFTILFDGVPMIYQGQEQHLKGSHTPENREAIWLTKYNTDSVLYKLIASLNAIRKHAFMMDAEYITTSSRSLYEGGSELVLVKGVEGLQVLTVLSNQGTGGKPYEMTLPFSYNAGTELMEVLNCQVYTVDNHGELTIKMDKGEPRVFYPTRLLDGSGLCGYKSSNITLAEIETGHKFSTSVGVNGAYSDRVSLTTLMLTLSIALIL
ncbi:glycoside hydrolase superfamily [Penicillium capsulatum]|uniref:alpha-amylase n=1 Tax=Penicillium capsulatum TaxID=69766 RepID=A0A9W9IKU4_9EURO|nr:glycoside hydrolase superfamily [Penicillium capsulatum]KAJ6122228.1 glycoside hydrolase superfamily [Penicillium capsulatum]